MVSERKYILKLQSKWVIALFLLLSVSPVFAAEEAQSALSFGDPLQHFFCENRENPGFQAFLRKAIEGPPKCSVNAKLNPDHPNAFYCSQIQPTDQTLLAHGLEESDFFTFELKQDLRRQIRTSDALLAARRAIDDYKRTVNQPLPSDCDQASKIQFELDRAEAYTILNERLACLAGNRLFAEQLTRNVTEQDHGPGTIVALTQALGSRLTLTQMADQFSEVTINDGADVLNEDLHFLGPTLHHLFTRRLKTPESRNKLCYYASEYIHSVQEQRRNLHAFDFGLTWTGIGAAGAGAAVSASNPHSRVAHRLHQVTEATAWGVAAIFSYRALKHFFAAIYPQSSLGQLSLFLDTNPYDNACKNKSLIPDFLNGTLVHTENRNEALLWQSLAEGAAAFCTIKCFELGAHAVRGGAAFMHLSKKRIRSVIESKAFLRENFHRIDWDRATPEILRRLHRFFKKNPETVADLETAAELQMGAAIVGAAAMKATARGTVRGGQEYLVATAATEMASEEELMEFYPDDPWDSDPERETRRCTPVIPKDKLSLYGKYLERKKTKKRNPFDCLLIGKKN